MSLESKLRQIKSHVYDALDDYCEELEEKEKANVHEWIGNERDSIITKFKSDKHAVVGIDEATLLRLQWNVNKVNYAKYDISGHKAVVVPFTKRVPDSTESDGMWWHMFPKTSGYSPISDAFRDMPKFSHFYKRI